MDIEVLINVQEQEVKDMLIAILPDYQFTGFEEREDSLAAYINEADFNEATLETVLQQFNLNYSKTFIEKKNWNALWESSFSPVLVDNFCMIRADFHAPSNTVAHEIIVTPKMSFGTGHHATTYLMVQQMKEIDFANKQAADFGTGTGVLSILAEKLGSNYIWAIDNDDWSIDNAKENFERNNCKRITLQQIDVFSPADKFNIILANINRNIILQNFNGLVLGLLPGALLLLSGLLKQDGEEIINAAQIHHLLLVKTLEKDNWICLLFKSH